MATTSLSSLLLTVKSKHSFGSSFVYQGVYFCYAFRFLPSLTFFSCNPEEILERFRAKKEEELEEVKRRAAEEAQKALLEKERKEGDVEKEDGDAKTSEEGQPEGKIEALAKEEVEPKDEGSEEIDNGVKTGGD